MESFVLSPNCVFKRVCGFGSMPRSTDADKERHIAGAMQGLFTEWAWAMAGRRDKPLTQTPVAVAPPPGGAPGCAVRI